MEEDDTQHNALGGKSGKANETMLEREGEKGGIKIEKMKVLN